MKRVLTVLTIAAAIGFVAPRTSAARKPKLPEVRKAVVTGVGLTTDQALKNALVGAVEQTVGVLVDAEQIVRKNDVLEEKIITATNAFVEKHEVIKRWDKGTLHYCRIVAHVRTRKLIERLRANNVETTLVQGEDIAGEIVTHEHAKQGAAAIVEACLKDLPNKVLTIKRTGKLVPISPSRLRIPVEIAVDTKAYAKIMADILPKLDKIARMKVGGVLRYRSPKPGAQLFLNFRCRELERVDPNPVSPPSGKLFPKLWFGGHYVEVRLVQDNFLKKAKARGQRLAAVCIITDFSATGVSTAVVYGLDPEAVASLEPNRRAKAVVGITLLDAAGGEVASRELAFTSVGGEYLKGLILSAGSKTYPMSWPFVGVWPGAKYGGAGGDHYFTQAWTGNVYIDVLPADVKRIKTLKLSVRWAAK